jgi:hypothetical protein
VCYSDPRGADPMATGGFEIVYVVKDLSMRRLP